MVLAKQLSMAVISILCVNLEIKFFYSILKLQTEN